MAIQQERDKRGPFTSVYDFIERINLSTCNKKCIENLATAGAFDSFGNIRRDQFFAANDKGELFLDSLVRYGLLYQQDRAASANTLFGESLQAEISKPEIPQCEPWSELERLNRERDLIGIYISGHPLDEYRVVLDKLCTVKASALEDLYEIGKGEVIFGGIVASVSQRPTSKGKPFGQVRIEDMSGSYDFRLFGQDWATWGSHFSVGNCLFITARIEPHRWHPDELELHISNIKFLDDVRDKELKRFTIQAEIESLDETTADELSSLILSSPGSTLLYFNILDSSEGRHVMLQSPPHGIRITSSLLDFIDTHEGIDYRIND